MFIDSFENLFENLYKKNKETLRNVIKLRDDEPSRYYCLDGIFI